MSGNDERKIHKRINTLYPSGIRIGNSNGTFILEFLDDREDSLEVIFSGALQEELIKDLYEKFSVHLGVIQDNEEI